jgi:predicted nucleic acid-binding protein
MKILIDTNIIIDYLSDRIPFADHAEQLIELCEQGEVEGFLSASAVTDIYYILRKTENHEKIIDSLKILFSVLNIAEAGKNDLLRAF